MTDRDLQLRAWAVGRLSRMVRQRAGCKVVWCSFIAPPQGNGIELPRELWQLLALDLAICSAFHDMRRLGMEREARAIVSLGVKA